MTEKISPPVTNGTMKDTEISIFRAPAYTNPDRSRAGVANGQPWPPLTPTRFLGQRDQLAKVTVNYRRDGIVIATVRPGERLLEIHEHWPMPCDVCGEVTLTDEERACRMTPGCEGRHCKPSPNPEEQK